VRRYLQCIALVATALGLSSATAAAAPKLRLVKVAGLPAANRSGPPIGGPMPAARDLAIGPGKEVWMTGDGAANYLVRVSPQGKLLATYPTGGTPDSIVAGRDGAMWFTMYDGNAVGRITRQGAITTFPVPIAGAGPRGIALGADGALWLTLFRANQVARLTTGGTWTTFSNGLTPGGQQLGITRGPGGIWFTEPRGDRIVRITPDGGLFPVTVSTASGPEAVEVGVDGNVWFTEDDGNRIGRVTPKGEVTEFQSGITPRATTFSITAGPDEAMWFTEADGDRIGRSTPDGSITEYPLPPHSRPFGIITGPDRRLWVALAGTGGLIRITPPPAPVIPVQINYATRTDGGVTTFKQLLVEDVPAVGRVRLTCRGSGCPLRRFQSRRGVARVDLHRKLRRVGGGARIQVTVFAPGYSSAVRLFRVASGGASVSKRCIVPRSRKLRRTCG
jgi:streptogramin lyase